LKVKTETSSRRRKCAEVNPHGWKCSEVKLLCKPRKF
jgi:hypothetical protein